jgi:hypothetical protein
MRLLDVDADGAAALYPHKLLLSRPDQHVAWRGDRPPDDPLALIDRVRGAFVTVTEPANGFLERKPAAA